MPATGVPIIDWLLAALDAWGYLIVFLATVFENLFVVGSITPGETIVIAASFVAAQRLLTLRYIWLASVCGTLIGGNLSYLLGRRVGLDAVRAFVVRVAASRTGRLLRIHPSSLDDIHEHFHTDGAKTVFVSRFAVGVKNFVPAVAGATRMPYFWFLLYTLFGTLTYTSTMVAIGWFLGNNIDVAVRVASTIGWAGLLLLALVIGGAVFARREVKGRRAERREEEIEGASRNDENHEAAQRRDDEAGRP